MAAPMTAAQHPVWINYPGRQSKGCYFIFCSSFVFSCCFFDTCCQKCILKIFKNNATIVRKRAPKRPKIHGKRPKRCLEPLRASLSAQESPGDPPGVNGCFGNLALGALWGPRRGPETAKKREKCMSKIDVFSGGLPEAFPEGTGSQNGAQNHRKWLHKRDRDRKKRFCENVVIP